MDIWESVICPPPRVRQKQLPIDLLYRLPGSTSALWIFRNANTQSAFQQYLFTLSHMPQCLCYPPSSSSGGNWLNLSEWEMAFPFLSKIWQALPSRGEMKEPRIISLKQTSWQSITIKCNYYHYYYMLDICYTLSHLYALLTSTHFY